MKKYILFTFLAIIVSISLKAQNKHPKPLTVKVEFIEKTETGFEVWVKHHDPHYYFRSFHLVKTFSILPDSIRIGNTLIRWCPSLKLSPTKIFTFAFRWFSMLDRKSKMLFVKGSKFTTLGNKSFSTWPPKANTGFLNTLKIRK